MRQRPGRVPTASTAIVVLRIREVGRVPQVLSQSRARRGDDSVEIGTRRQHLLARGFPDSRSATSISTGPIPFFGELRGHVRAAATDDNIPADHENGTASDPCSRLVGSAQTEETLPIPRECCTPVIPRSRR